MKVFRLIVLLFIYLFSTPNKLVAQTPYVLTGNEYYQNFDTIGTGLPIGWSVRTGCNGTSNGAIAAFNNAPTPNNAITSGFYNYTGYDGSRAPGVYQGNALNQTGATFAFVLNNTTGKTGFNLAVDYHQLNSLGGASRITTWQVDYGIGAVPTAYSLVGTTFTATGGVFLNNQLKVTLPALIDNNVNNIWVRIRCTNTGGFFAVTYPTVAIDNFHLTWTCTAPAAILTNNNSVCSGGAINLTTTAVGGTAPYTYKWYGPNSFFSTSQNPSIASATALNAGTYTSIVSPAAGCEVVSTTNVMVTTPTVTATSATVCLGNSAALSVTSTTTMTTTYSNANVDAIPDGAGSTTSTINVSGLAGTVGTRLSSVRINISHMNTGDLTVALMAPNGSQINLVQNRGGTGDYFVNTVFSTSAGTVIGVGVNPFTGSYTPEQPFSTLSGSNISGDWQLIVTDGAGTNSGLLINWQMIFNHTNNYSWAPITSLAPTTGTSVTANPLATTLYTVTVTDGASCVSTAVSTFSVSPAPTTTAPSNQTICQGASANFSTTVSGGIPPYTYQWQEDNGVSGYLNITNGGVYGGATTANLSITGALTSMNSYRYRCVVNDACGSVLTGNAQLFVTPAISYASSTVTQPTTSDVTRCEANVVILRMNINMNTGSCPSIPSVIGFSATMSGTFLEASNVQVYYTGASSVFVPTNQFGANLAPNNSLTISGTQTLSGGNNYFWLVYDINPTGTGVLVDATWDDFTIVGGNNPGTYVPPITDPGPGRSIVACAAPGGVVTGLTYWLKSNDGSNIQSSTHDALIGNWCSSFSNDFDLQQTVGVKKPLFKNYGYDTTFNFNPYLSFDGSDDILQSTNLLGSGLLDDDGLALVVCATAVVPNDRAIFGYKEADPGPYYQINPEGGMLLKNSAGKLTEIVMTDFSLLASNFPMAKVVGIRGVSAGPDFADFVQNSEVILPTLGGTADAEDGLSLGANGDGFTHGNNTVAEIITYSGGVSNTDLQRIQSYVGIKYGLHMDQNYLASDGTTVVWDYATNATYDFDIAGIARDDKSGLYQKQSQSVNTDEIMTVGLTSITTSNASNAEVFDADKSFLLWGNNDEMTVSDYSTLAPTATPLLPLGIQGRIKRVWKFQGTNFNSVDFNRTNGANEVMATKTLTLGFDAHTLAGSFVAGPNNTIKVLVDDDGVDWSDAVVVGGGVVVTTTTASGARIMFPNVTIEPDKNYVTLATTDALMLPLASEITHFSAECKNGYNFVKWITAIEIDVDNFTLQRSKDAVNFIDVYSVNGRGTNASNTVYTFEDANPLMKGFYYRIKQKTNTGTYVYSKTITTDASCAATTDGKLILSVAPNPVSHEMQSVNLNYANNEAEEATISIKNVLGIVCNEFKVALNEQINSITVPVANLKSGLYLIEFNCGNQTQSVKFIKE